MNTEMAHPKPILKRPRRRELQTICAARARRKLITLSRHGVGRKAVHEFTGLDHRTLGKIKNGQTRFVRKETRDLILSVPLNAHCDRALVDSKRTREMIVQLMKRPDTGFTKSEIAKRLGAKPKRFHATLNIARKGKVLARSQMRIEKLYNDAIGKAA